MGWVLAASLKDPAADGDGFVSTARTLGSEWVHLIEEGACEDR